MMAHFDGSLLDCCQVLSGTIDQGDQAFLDDGQMGQGCAKTPI